MNDKYFIGKKALSLTEYSKSEPITGVILLLDDENYYQAGNETGTVIEESCPYATQEMANNLLTALQGYQYQPLVANGARVSPLIELGDGITVDGIYTQLAYQNIRFSTGEVVDVAAPGSAETLHEYKTEGETTRSFNRKIAETRSTITKNAKEIALRIDGLEDEYTELSVTLDGVTITDASGTTKIRGSSIETQSLYVDAAHITGSLTIGQLPSDVATTSDIPQYTSDLINNSGYQTAQGVTTIINGTVTTDYVNALGITAGSVSASNITGGTIQAAAMNLNGLLGLQYYGGFYGYVGASTAGDAPGAVLTDTTQANYIIVTNYGVRMSSSGNAQIWVSGGNCYSSSEIQVYSDRNLKNTITYEMEKYSRLFDNLKPCFYKMNSEGEDAKFRLGFVAQDIQESLTDSGLTLNDVAFLGISEEYCTIGYGELIPLNTWKIKQLEKRIAELEEKIA